MCATLGQATCSETPHPTGCSRLGTAEVDSFALVAQQAEQPPCKRQAARSIRRRGHHQTSRVRLDGRGHHSFKVDTRVRIPHAIPVQEPSSSSRFEGGNRPQRLGGAGTRDRMDFIGCVAQLGEQPPCKRQVAGSSPATSTMFASLTQRQSAGLSSRKPRVRIPHEAPDHLAEIAQEAERRVESACVGGSKPSLGTRQNLVSSVGFRAPVYEAGGRTFESCTRCQQRVCGREADCGCL